MKIKIPTSWPPIWLMTVWLIFFINPFIDAATGYIVLSDESEVGGLGSPSQLFRLALSILMIFQISKQSHLISTIIFVIYLIDLELFNFMFHGQISGLAIGITYSYKLAFGILMFFVLDKYINHGLFTFNNLLKYVVYSGVIYSGIVLFSDILGISFPSYGATNLGSRGVFASANGLGIYVGVCSLIAIYLYHNSPKKIYVFYYFLMAYVLLGLMTRAGIGLLAIGLSLWFVRIPWKFKLPILGFAVSFILIFIDQISDLVIGATEMITYRFKNADISFQGLVIGGRQDLFDRATENFTGDGYLWYRYIIGGGYFMSYRNPFNFAHHYSPILEADLWDVFYMFGCVGIVIYLSIFTYGLTVGKGDKGSSSYILKIAWVMLFFHSAFAGHVIQSGQSVMMIVALILILKYREYGRIEIIQKS